MDALLGPESEEDKRKRQEWLAAYEKQRYAEVAAANAERNPVRATLPESASVDSESDSGSDSDVRSPHVKSEPQTDSELADEANDGINVQGPRIESELQTDNELVNKASSNSVAQGPRMRSESQINSNVSSNNTKSKRPLSSTQERAIATLPERPAKRVQVEKLKALTMQSFASFKPRRKTTRGDVTPVDSPISAVADDVACTTVVAPPKDTTTRSAPGWYSNVASKDPPHRGLLTRILRVKECICPAQMQGSHNETSFKKIRGLLHGLLLLDTPDLKQSHWPVTVKGSKILSDTHGLPRIFDSRLAAEDNQDYPWDIRADAHEVYLRWHKGDFDTNILRGIKIKKVGNRSADSIDEKAKVPWNYFGAGTLVNGQWWPTQLTTVRDGTHGSAQGGIAGIRASDVNVECGAVSIVLAGGYKEDRDEGDEIWYSGTEGSDCTPTENTKRKVESVQGYLKDGELVRNPVRVVRSYNLGNKSKYTPRKGFRYDGLYDVLDFEIVDEEKQIHLFHLKRCPGQDPIRATGEEARPTDDELRAYEKARELSKDLQAFG